MKPALSLIAASVLFLSACGGSSSDSSIPGLKADTNVALLSRGASASSSHNSSNANNLIDGNINTSWTSASGQKIVVDFGSVEKIKSIKLIRQAGAVITGSNPDILIELSANGSSYTASNLSVVTGGIPCTSRSMNETTMSCTMAERDTRYIRITSQNGNAHDFFELEALATK
ncbi:discoidin domain-containing protein [Thalassolituus sp. ST750PaO-4]|uniref:discoidin domain-containing protein n=1 Tax=Thalassolituus sp. ST750PaO-4 TaxID=2742965 RepID=UPI001CE2BC1A|nr:discoidin domain-containing protein [Thalassolituus sp. ST750PaO-4]MCA6059855.1 discoidin domain-containing protein [Thalassolituus sp. ST750PaO-4]